MFPRTPNLFQPGRPAINGRPLARVLLLCLAKRHDESANITFARVAAGENSVGWKPNGRLRAKWNASSDLCAQKVLLREYS